MIWTPRRAMLMLVVTNLLWAGTYVAGKGALRSLTPVELNCLRFGLASVVFAPLLWLQRGTFGLGRADVPRLALLCVLGFVLNKAAEFSGLDLSTASDTALLIAAEGVFTAVFGWLLLGEAARGYAVLGMLVSVIGVYLVVERGLVLPHLGGGTRVVGDLLVLVALVFEALYTVLGKNELQRHSGLVITGVCVIGSMAVWLPAAAVDVATRGAPHLTAGAWLGVVYLAIAGTVLAYIFWIVALRYVTAAAAAPTLFIQPLAGAILAVVLLGERLTWGTFVGGLLIILGIFIVSRDQTGAGKVVTPRVPHR